MRADLRELVAAQTCLLALPEGPELITKVVLLMCCTEISGCLATLSKTAGLPGKSVQHQSRSTRLPENP